LPALGESAKGLPCLFGPKTLREHGTLFGHASQYSLLIAHQPFGGDNRPKRPGRERARRFASGRQSIPFPSTYRRYMGNK
jgi:hypothetical protein